MQKHIVIRIIVVALAFRCVLYAEVNQNTGRMFLSEPLFEIKGNTVSLPISLNYTSGVKVNQRASWVGLGFEIGLPYIERIPQGSADEKSGDFSCNGLGYYSKKHYRQLISETSNGWQLAGLPKGDFTARQDVYMLNAPFATDRIIFAVMGDDWTEALPAYLQNMRAVQISYKVNKNDPNSTEDDEITAWEIVDVDGTKYTFGNSNGSGIVKAEAHPGRFDENTSETWEGRNGNWLTNISRTDERIYGHYVNEKFNIRWYLTEIRSPTGEIITLSYAADESLVSIKDLFFYAGANHRAATSVHTYALEEDIYASFDFAYDNYYISPVYPLEIVSNKQKAKFYIKTSPSQDVLLQGNKCIDRIELFTHNTSGFLLVSQLKFSYLEDGLAIGHKYSTNIEKGLLGLSSVTRLSADGLRSMPIIAFDYRNPAFGGFYRHDLYGFNSVSDLRRASTVFPPWPAGQSATGTNDLPGAEAWSVCRVTYGNGKIEEYEYEPNHATMLTTNEPVASDTHLLRPGIRVHTWREYDGISNLPITRRYQYGTGYAQYSFALSNGVDALYEMLNYQAYRDVANVMVLNPIDVEYEKCTALVTNAGSISTTFLSPASVLTAYNSEASDTLNDRHVIDNGVPMYAINSLSHCRGLPLKVEQFRDGTSSNPIASQTNDYWVDYRKRLYFSPSVDVYPNKNCPLGEPPDSVPPNQWNWNQTQNDYVGAVVPRSTIKMQNGVTTSEEIISYSETSEGIPILPEVVRKTNSCGKKLLMLTKLACHEYKPDGNPAYEGLLEANLLSYISQSISYEKTSEDQTHMLGNKEVRAAQASTYSNLLGCSQWLPYRSYSWQSLIMGTESEKEFAPFDHAKGQANDNWICQGFSNKYTSLGSLIESYDAAEKPSTILLNTNESKAILAVANARNGECLFTNWAENVPANKNIAEYRMGTELSELHFAPRTLILSTDLSDTIGDQFAASAYTLGDELLPDLANRTFVVQFWAKATGMTTPSVWSFIHLQAITSNSWSSHVYFELTPEWKRYEFELTFPGGVTTKQYRVVLRPPRKPNAEYVQGAVFYDDVRVTPKGSLATTTYYEPKWRTPILTLDANNQPGNLVENDAFGRPVKWYKLNTAYSQNNPNFKVLRIQKEYHLVGEN